MTGAPAPAEFAYLPLQRVVHGADAAAHLAREADRLGARRIVLVTGTTLATKTDLPARVRAILGDRVAATFTDTAQHVPREAVRAGVAVAREVGADALVSLGGGSAIDCAKAIALVLAEGERWDACRVVFELPDTLSVPALPAPKLPHLAVPTTLSGAEFTHIAGVTRADAGVKQIFLDPQLVPRVVFLDPAFTLATGPELWASTGVKALDHAVESVYSVKHNPFTDALCLDAVRLLFAHLRRSIAAPDDVGARLALQHAAWLACFGITNTWVGLGHALCHQVGARCGVPHGIAAGILLPHAMAFNRPATVERQALLARAMGVTGGTSAEAAVEAGLRVRGLVRGLGLPSRLRDVGVRREVLAMIAEHTGRDFVVRTNPRPIRSESEILELLEAAW